MVTAQEVNLDKLIKPEILEKIQELYKLPFTDLVFKAQQVLQDNHDTSSIQFCTLSSIKTGACPEDCKYCPQSAKHNTNIETHKLLNKEEIISQAQAAKNNGSTRFCMGASWRDLPEKEFENLTDIIQTVDKMNMEVCCTLGMVNADQALRLKQAGLHTYNHNIDTSPDYYSEIITTRKFEERIATILNIQEAGINVCSGGILGMGETVNNRLQFLAVLASLPNNPDSVPINTLVPVKGTPLEDSPPLDPIELVKIVAIARIMMPKAKVRLSAGRVNMSDETQALCFVAGANSIHTGEKLLTTPNQGLSSDIDLMNKLNMKILKS